MPYRHEPLDPGPKVKVWPVIGCAIFGIAAVALCGSGWIVALLT